MTMDDLFAQPARPRGDGGSIHVGIGGWTYAPWRGGVFYPEKLAQRRELEYASRQLTAIEINGTYYGAQKPETYARWRDQTPEGFLFTAKAPRRIMESRRLAATGAQVEDFIGGIAALGERLGALLWQFDRGQSPAPAELLAFLDLLPAATPDGRRLRHALELRDRALFTPDLVTQLRARNIALVHAGSDEHPSFADLTADFCYARLMQARDELPCGYTDAELDAWAGRARAWAAGQDPQDLPQLRSAPPGVPRQVFVFFIAAAKHRNPAAAQALLARL